MSIIDRYAKTDYTSYEDFYNNFKINIPDNFNFAYDIMDQQAIQRPDARALVWCNDEGEERTFTFSEMKTLSDKTANFFLSQGISKGDFVMLILKRHWQYWTAALALHKIGAVLIPATHMLTPKDIYYRITAADVKMIVASNDDRLLNSIDEACTYGDHSLKVKAVVNGKSDGYIDFDAGVIESSEQFERPTGEDDTRNDDMLLVYFTSGTTGMPKMVAHNHIYPLGHILTAKFWHTLTEDDLHLAVADTGWAKCSWGKIYGQWICGAAIFVYDYDSKFKPLDLIRVVEKYGITVFCAPPTIYRFLIKEDISQFDLSKLRRCCTAGEPLNPEVFNKWKQFTGLEIKEGFGQTETTVLIATFPWIKSRPGSTGKACPHYNIKLINEYGDEAEIGALGEICVDISNGMPAGLTMGYYKDELKTLSAMAGGYYHTGDIAWRDEDGYFWFEGRADDVIKSSGYRIGPFEVESALLEHPAVLEAAITGVPDPIRGQIVKATVVLVKSGKYLPCDELIVELQEHVKNVTAPYKYPRIIEFVDELPKTISGKIRRVEIREKESK